MEEKLVAESMFMFMVDVNVVNLMGDGWRWSVMVGW